MLIDRFGNLDLDKNLQSAAEFAPFPKAVDRNGWAAVTPETRAAWVNAAEQFRDYQWPALSAGFGFHFQRTGENLPALHRFWERRSALGILAIAECIEGEGRFMDQIVGGVYSICEETVWMTPFDLEALKQTMPAPQDVIVNLATSETGALLAWVSYLFGSELDAASPRIRERIRKEVHDRLIVPYLGHDDYWWMGFVPTPRVNNWNPWCNRNMLKCTLLIDFDPAERQGCVRKAMRSLDSYMAKYPPDGCCDEGPMYWGAAGGGLHTCLKLLQQASRGVIDVFDAPIVQDIGRYIYKAHIHDRWFVDFADGDALVGAGVVAYHYGRSIGDECLSALGASAGPGRPFVLNWFGAYEHLLDIFTEEERRKAATRAPYVRDAWMAHTQVMFAREKEGSPKGLYVAAKAGHNGESHNHNDIGNFIVYADGCPVLIDLGTEEYSAKTFSPQRFELWYLQSQYHNCPTVRGVLQHEGADWRAAGVEYEAGDHAAELRADIARAYPSEAGIESWRRAVRLNRGEGASVEVTDDYRLTSPASDVMWSLMTPLVSQQTAPGRLELEYAPGSRVAILYDNENLSAEVERIDYMESRLRKNWGDVMYRIVLREKAVQQQAIRKLIITKVLRPQ